MKTKIIGRKHEFEQLQRCMDSNRSEFVIVYGRRRVGKTFLVDSFFNQKYDFSYIGGHKLSKRVQLRNFAKALKQVMKTDTTLKFDDWFDAFDALEEYLASLSEDRKKVIFIDEMPWIDSFRSEFISALENFWNAWAARRSDIVFVASGSATSWMVDNLVENQGGLHARITCQIYVRPFTLNETYEYLKNSDCVWDKFQIAQCYMFLGGIPFYLSLLEPKKSLVQNIDMLCFRRGGELQMEFNELYNALFSDADSYVEVVKLLAAHRNGLTKSELSSFLKFDGSRLAKILINLERCDFVIKFRYYRKKTKDCVYKLIDFYTLFYLKYIEPNIENFDEQWWSRNYNSHSVESWQGLTFELLCLMHIPQIRKALGINGIATDISAWFYRGESGLRGSQVDLIIERADRIIHLCEVKFSVGKYRISADLEQKIRERMMLFREKTHTTKSLTNIFITTYGVLLGEHSSVVDGEVTLDDLFL